jgi:hypothetical protein
MGFPVKKLIDIGIIAAGAAGVNIPQGNKEALELEVKENQLLAAILKNQQLQTTVLLKILHDAIGDEEFDAFLKELG